MKAFILSLVLMTGLIASPGAFADENEAPHPTEASISLNCDTQVPGSTCPAKYSTNVGLLTDTTPRAQNNNPESKSPTDK